MARYEEFFAPAAHRDAGIYKIEAPLLVKELLGRKPLRLLSSESLVYARYKWLGMRKLLKRE
jgi:hypothetical protein